MTTRVIREAIDDDVSEPTEQASTRPCPRPTADDMGHDRGHACRVKGARNVARR
jgi:hypothetical protein